MKNTPDVDFLIFDLGNVIIDIDYERTFRLIKSKIPTALHEKVDFFYLTDFHKAYEKGLIDSPSFRNEVRAYFDQEWSDGEVDEIWNSLLGNIPSYRIDLVKKLKEKYQLGVLSNTNEIHIQGVYELLNREHQLDNFDSLFDWVFYSHEMGLAKPSVEIYEKLVVELGTSPDRVLFFDDLLANVEGARKIGIHAIQVTGPEVLLDFFKDV
ncbi:putative hydrolase of the HAD superfamily [Algoriphagus aquaeductus]|uniref:Putative hydrolase of the HAD superfamily n=1 Tax=Algoriphagus aquaeductus TaxID=475299 RepID=A0A326RMJ1_9BACT|nr:MULTISPECIES: HAD family phosphatase [Algoriphagus]PZV81575.1 putative hydrolase of the HAD superfamily [Algoriphagus aquaeductus]